VDVPWEIKKINSVYNNTGMEGLLEEVRDLIGYVPDYYFVMEMDIVAQLVDAMGGVDYEVPYDMHYDDPTQDLHIHYDAGMQHLTGEDAVKVLRWRQNNSGPSLSVGDVGRVEVQQSFMKAMIGQALSFSTLTNIKEIAHIVDTNLDSNLTYGEMVWFGEHALFLQEDGTRFHSLPGDYTGRLWSQTYQNYQSYVFVNDAALLDIINNHMNPYTTAITPDMQHVIYGTTVNNLPTTEDTAGQ
jgi:LCP family protein required for cell wall assembly